jgi:hypothetical protein
MDEYQFLKKHVLCYLVSHMCKSLALFLSAGPGYDARIYPVCEEQIISNHSA